MVQEEVFLVDICFSDNNCRRDVEVTQSTIDWYRENTNVQIIFGEAPPTIPDPTEPEAPTNNTEFTIRYFDGTSTSWVLTNSDFEILDSKPPSLDYAITNINPDTTRSPVELALVESSIALKLNSKPNDETNETMVSQSIGAFSIKDGRVLGEVLYIANSSFNSFYYGKPIKSILQFKNLNNQVINIKENDLVFTETERDQRIQIDESQGEPPQNPIIIDFFVMLSQNDQRAFSDPKQIQIEEGQPPPPDPPPIVVKQDSIFKALKGLLFGSVALTLLGTKGK